jgi:hypothetical protein
MALRRTFAGLLAVPGLLLAGCGGDSSVADPPVRSSPTSSATSSPPAHETAEHFIRRWAAEDTRIQQTGDTKRFREMSQGCRGCIRLANLVDRIYANGGFVRTRGWRVIKIDSAGNQTYELYVRSAPTTYANSNSSPVHHLPSGPAHFQLKVARSEDEWRVTSLVQVSS